MRRYPKEERMRWLRRTYVQHECGEPLQSIMHVGTRLQHKQPAAKRITATICKTQITATKLHSMRAHRLFSILPRMEGCAAARGRTSIAADVLRERRLTLALSSVVARVIGSIRAARIAPPLPTTRSALAPSIAQVRHGAGAGMRPSAGRLLRGPSAGRRLRSRRRSRAGRTRTPRCLLCRCEYQLLKKPSG